MSAGSQHGGRSSVTTHAELMRQMGTPAHDGFDPMPPRQHTWFLDVGEAATSRAIAWVWSKTIRPGKGNKRSPFARDERGALTLKHAAADLGWEMSNASAVFAKLASQERIRKDQKGHFWLQGDVPEPRRTEGETRPSEEEAKQQVTEICTYKLPKAFGLYLEQLPKNESVQRQQDYFRLQEYRKKIEADAMAAARATGQELEQKFFQAIGFEHRTLRGRPKLEREELAVQLSLTSLPQLSVYISSNANSVQNGHGASYTNQNGSVQITPSLLSSSEYSENRVSEERPPETPSPERTPPPTPLTHKAAPKTPPNAKPSDEGDEVTRTVERLLGRRLGQDPLRGKFSALASQHDIPVRSLVRFLEDKHKEKRAAGYAIHNPGALYKFAVEDLPGWIRQHGNEIDSDERWEASIRRQQLNQEPLPDADELRREMHNLATKKGISPRGAAGGQP